MWGSVQEEEPVLLVSEPWSSRSFHQLFVLDANTLAVPWLSLVMGTITPCDNAHLELVAHPGPFKMPVSVSITTENIFRTQGLLDGRILRITLVLPPKARRV